MGAFEKQRLYILRRRFPLRFRPARWPQALAEHGLLNDHSCRSTKLISREVIEGLAGGECIVYPSKTKEKLKKGAPQREFHTQKKCE